MLSGMKSMRAQLDELTDRQVVERCMEPAGMLEATVAAWRGGPIIYDTIEDIEGLVTITDQTESAP
jgi:hypothetical protein